MAAEEKSYYIIEEDLRGDWLDEMLSDGISEFEAYLQKHADFLIYLARRDAEA